MRERFRNFMVGRYGPDQLNVALFIAALILEILGSLFRFFLFSLIAYALLIFAVYRMFSRNIVKRRAENDVFLRYWGPFRHKASGFKERMASRKDYKFFRCPNCKNMLRVPRGKGRIQVTCPKCGERFEKRS